MLKLGGSSLLMLLLPLAGAAQISFSVDTVDFPPTTVDSTRTLTLTISNDLVVVQSVAFSGVSGPFSLSADSISIPGESSAEVNVVFSPVSVNTFTMNLSIARPLGALLAALLALTLVGLASAYSTPNANQQSPRSAPSQTAVSRGAFLATAASAACATFLPPRPAFAKDIDPALKGTKADPEFQTCLSQCVYECTKPKGAEQKSRAECLPECKSKCATTKAQLMKGEPKKE